MHLNKKKKIGEKVQAQKIKSKKRLVVRKGKKERRAPAGALAQLGP
jgi:hypothetical protein